MRSYRHLSIVLLLVGAILSACGDDEDPSAPQPADTLLASSTLSTGYGYPRLEPDPRYGFALLFWEPGSQSATPDHVLFGDAYYGPEDSGRRVVLAGEEDDPDFPRVVAMLTNGQDDRMGSQHVVQGGGGASSQLLESILLRDPDGEPLTPDLEGATVTRIVLVIEEITVDIPGRDLQGDGIWTDTSFRVRFEIRGSAPAGLSRR